MAHLQFRASPTLGWNDWPVGAGGLLSGIDIAPDGTMVVRADTYGAYRWNGTRWVQLMTTASMPAADYSIQGGDGVYEIRIAPSNSNIMYMMHDGYVYRTANAGVTWYRTNFTQVTAAPNDNQRVFGSKMAIDPNNPDHVIAGTPQNKAWRTTNGGNTWTQISSIATSGTTGGEYPGHTVAFVDSSNIYLSSYGTGVYLSTNGGTSFSLTSNGPTTGIRNWCVAADGILYAVDDAASNTNIWKCNAGTWTQLTNDDSSSPAHSVACNPADATHIVRTNAGGTTNQSFDRGVTWTGPYNLAENGGPADVVKTASDIPWLANTLEDYLSHGQIIYHPSNGKIYMSQGIGVWRTTHPTTHTASDTITWDSISAGIEQLVANQIIAPPGGSPVAAFWDRPFFKLTDRNNYPSNHGPDYTTQIIHGWAIDYATSDPTFICGIANTFGPTDRSGYSTDGGATWTRFAARPTHVMDAQEKIGGCIAASTPLNMVWVPSNSASPYYTKDGGATWTELLLSGVPTHPSTTGWGAAYYFCRHIVTADRVTANKFYMYNCAGSGSGGGVWVSTDSGDNWSRVFSGSIAGADDINAKLKAIPGHAGHLVFTVGGGDGGIWLSTDAGVTWDAVPNTSACYDIGFGKAFSGGYDPTVFIIGKISGVHGIWYSTDFDQATPTWTRISDGYPRGRFEIYKSITGEWTTPGKCLVGFGGSGVVHYTP